MAKKPASSVPFYRQSYDFTCGPACLIMAMMHYDPKVRPSRELEIDIWREANLIEAYATSQYGLAMAAHRRGFSSMTWGNAKADRLLDCLCRSCRIEMDSTQQTIMCGLVARPVKIHDHRLCLLVNPENRVFALSLLQDLRRRCRRARIPAHERPVTMSTIGSWLAAGWIPIIMVDARLVGDEEVPHWVVITRCSGKTVTFHDPLALRGASSVKTKSFANHMGFHGTVSALVVRGRI